MKVKPIAYTKEKGGEPFQWQGGKVNKSKLPISSENHHRNTVVVAGIECHAIAFLDGDTWDCENGWYK